MEKFPSGSDSRDLALGCGSSSVVSQITLNITTTTGGNFSVVVESQITVESLKKIIAKKLKVAKDRICLLHREKELQEGTLKDNGLMDESKIILIPNVETGLLAQRPENTVMQALESLNDSQVNDFLSGKTPLNLSMRLGDHMMLIQLQLSTVNPSSPSHAARTKNSIKSKISSAQSSHPSTTISHTETVTTETTQRSRSNSIDLSESNTSISTSNADVATTPETPSTARQRDLILTSRQLEDLKSIVHSLSNIQQQQQQSSDDSSFESDSLLEQSPIKSLSNLVSSPIKTIPIKSIPIADFAAASTSNATDPNYSQTYLPQPSTSSLEHNYSSSSNSNGTPKPLRSPLLHRTINNPIAKSKQRQFTNAYLRRSKSSDNIRSNESTPSTSTIAGQSNFLADSNPGDAPVGLNGGDTRALAEASRNLTQTLRKLSKEVFTNKVDVAEENQRKNANGCGAVIESMKNHGKGIYSGTFSGTLNPALQDRYGRPKRDISTVIHILNDLLSATPQYSRGARISFEPTANRAIKQAPTRTTFQKDTICTKCSTTRSLNCIYGECTGHSTDYYCDKHRPINEPTSTIQMPLSSCRCARILKLDESSNDSLNSSDCQCQFRSFDPTAPEEATSNSGIADLLCVQPVKQVCIKCSSIELENSKTKSKLDQLRLVMRQKKERREARKLNSTPYGDKDSRTAIVALAGSSNSLLNNSTITSTITSQQQQQQQQQHQEQQTTNHNLVEEVDTAA
ncbi:hypothetical protein HA402_000251 [Bradysia odoriphaga]|nr:hypothetical protein HA402_000251 [Bradysia odoriphaga]